MQVVTAKEMYEIDRYAMEVAGIDGKILMENAGRSIASRAVTLIDGSQPILVLVGSGNNGGDGFVIARTLLNQGFDIFVAQLVPDHKIKGDAAYHRQLYINFGGVIQRVQGAEELKPFLEKSAVVVDAILGIGFSGELRSPLKQMISVVNECGALKLSVDIPSGIPADEGLPFSTGFNADYTFVIEHPKPSTFLIDCNPFYGVWEIVKIGLPFTVFEKRNDCNVWEDKNVRSTLPRRSDYSHKGNHGKGLIIGGCLEMPGSVTMTALAALRSGAGLLTVGTVREAIPSIASNCVEATFHSIASREGYITGRPLINLSPYDAIAIGMGMGRSNDTALFTRSVLENADIPVLVDADGLYHIKGDLSLLAKRQNTTVLTPHPGEMAMLMDCTVSEILAKPFEVSKSFACTYGVFLVLKGVFTIITDPKGNQWINTTGNAGLAKGGSGDVLSGVILTLMMQNKTTHEALANGVFIHGKAAEAMVSHQHSSYDLLATDVINGLSSVFRTLI